jgi:hypothetical protein
MWFSGKKCALSEYHSQNLSTKWPFCRMAKMYNKRFKRHCLTRVMYFGKNFTLNNPIEIQNYILICGLHGHIHPYMVPRAVLWSYFKLFHVFGQIGSQYKKSLLQRPTVEKRADLQKPVLCN